MTPRRRGQILSGMRIVDIEPILLDVPLREPVHGVHGVTSVQRSALVRVTSDEGVEGWGNVDPTPGYSAMSAAEIHDTVRRLGPALVGTDPFNARRALAAVEKFRHRESTAAELLDAVQQVLQVSPQGRDRGLERAAEGLQEGSEGPSQDRQDPPPDQRAYRHELSPADGDQQARPDAPALEELNERAQDGAFLSMVFDRAPVTELSKYGADVHYLPDSDQPYYPFIARLAGELLCSPATTGRRFDAALSWVAPYKDNVKVTGSTRLQGGINPKAQGKKVKVRLQHNDKVVWEAELTDTVEKTFELAAPVSKGDRLSLCVQNSGDGSGDITAIGADGWA